MRLIVFTCIMLSGITSLCGQSIHFKHLDMRDGLSANQVNDIVLDHNGFLLIATDQGLCKYDGRVVSLLSQVELPGFEKLQFASVCKDANLDIWVGTSKGLYFMNKAGIISPVSLPSKAKEIAVRKVLRVGEDLLLYTSRGWFLRTSDSREWVAYPILSSLIGNKTLQDLFITKAGDLIAVYNEKGIISINLEKQRILFDTPIDLAYCITSLQDDRLVCGTGTGMIHIIHPQQGSILQTFESTKKLGSVIIHKAVNDIAALNQNQVVFTAEDEGITLLDIVTGKETVYVQDHRDLHSLSSNQTVKILSDEQQNYYVTTLFNGIDFFNVTRYFILTKHVFEDESRQPFSSYINSISEDANGVWWLGVSDRVVEYHPETNSTKYHFYYEQLGTRHVNTLLGFRTTCVDRQGRIWQGSFKGGIVIYDPKNDNVVKLTKYAHQGGIRRIPASYIWQLMMDREGMIWAAHNFGFMKIDPLTWDVDTFDQHPVLNQIPRKRGKSVLEDHHGRIWFGTHYSGVYRFDKRTMTLDTFNAKNGLANHCYEMAEDDMGRVYIANEKGFAIIDQHDSITLYTIHNGLRNRLVEGFLFDGHHNVYIANHNTIIHFNPDTRQFKYFDEQFGIGEVGFISNTSFRSRDGRMVWGAETGFIAFDPAQITTSTTPHRLTIHAIYSSNGTKYAADQEVRISANEALTFEFSAVDLFGSKLIRYQYKLNEQDQYWIDLGTENKITFNSLTPGRYVFHARASVNGVDWIEAAQAPVVKIAVLFYKNPLFYVLILGLTIFLIGLGWYQRRSIQLKETMFKQQLSDLEVKAIRAQMNPHFVFNALNSIQYFTYSGNVDKANEYLSDFARLMRLVLQQSNDGFISLEDEVALLSLYLKIEALRFNSDFFYTIVVEDALEDAEHIQLPSMVIQPFVENAIKHGLIPKKGRKMLDISFYTRDGKLCCDIRDNGIGMQASKAMVLAQPIQLPHNSMGMELVRKRLDLYTSAAGQANTLEIKELGLPDSGMLITIHLPIKLQ